MRLVAALLVGVVCLALCSKYHVAAQYYKPISSNDAPQRLAYPKIGRTSNAFGLKPWQPGTAAKAPQRMISAGSLMLLAESVATVTSSSGSQTMKSRKFPLPCFSHAASSMVDSRIVTPTAAAHAPSRTAATINHSCWDALL